jgi:hypothetical protein
MSHDERFARSAAGYNGMTYGILKGYNEDMNKLFLKVINHYWLDGSCPAEWKKLKIIPITKLGKDIYNISYISDTCPGKVCRQLDETPTD